MPGIIHIAVHPSARVQCQGVFGFAQHDGQDTPKMSDTATGRQLHATKADDIYAEVDLQQYSSNTTTAWQAFNLYQTSY